MSTYSEDPHSLQDTRLIVRPVSVFESTYMLTCEVDASSSLKEALGIHTLAAKAPPPHFLQLLQWQMIAWMGGPETVYEQAAQRQEPRSVG